MEPVELELKTPIEFGEQTIDKLTFRPPTAKMMRRMPYREEYPMAAIFWLAGKCSGQPDVVIDRLAGEDLEEVIRIATDFMPGSRATGSKPSEP